MFLINTDKVMQKKLYISEYDQFTAQRHGELRENSDTQGGHLPK